METLALCGHSHSSRPRWQLHTGVHVVSGRPVPQGRGVAASTTTAGGHPEGDTWCSCRRGCAWQSCRGLPRLWAHKMPRAVLGTGWRHCWGHPDAVVQCPRLWPPLPAIVHPGRRPRAVPTLRSTSTQLGGPGCAPAPGLRLVQPWLQVAEDRQMQDACTDCHPQKNKHSRAGEARPAGCWTRTAPCACHLCGPCRRTAGRELSGHQRCEGGTSACPGHGGAAPEAIRPR